MCLKILSSRSQIGGFDELEPLFENHRTRNIFTCRCLFHDEENKSLKRHFAEVIGATFLGAFFVTTLAVGLPLFIC
ncbi:MAG: hypothetical protein K940chlam1_00938 [Candidatus Anoxychlamydiales bacterium]|nr:hypothetical protein [Candidatus Anoxychlamydiales bacterium]NGX35444.1 hypothetical protein [Candidatus Anoxychlamydiales bacterium]